MPGPKLPPIEVTVERRAALERLARRPTTGQQLAERARIVLLAADGVPLDRIARQLAVDRNVVRTWVDRYRAGGLAALEDRPRSGRPRTFSP